MLRELVDLFTRHRGYVMDPYCWTMKTIISALMIVLNSIVIENIGLFSRFHESATRLSTIILQGKLWWTSSCCDSFRIKSIRFKAASNQSTWKDEIESNNTGDDDHDIADDVPQILNFYITKVQSKTLVSTDSAEDYSNFDIRRSTRNRTQADVMKQAVQEISQAVKQWKEPIKKKSGLLKNIRDIYNIS